MSEWTAEREAELRASGWSDGEIRDYKHGFENALAKASAPLPAAPRPAAEGREWFPVSDHFPRNSELGRWQSETFAGALSKLVSPVDDAAQLAEARRLQDDREYRYGNRPDLSTCLHAVRHTGPRGMTLSGTTPEVVGVLRNAGIAVIVAQEYRPPALANGASVSRT